SLYLQFFVAPGGHHRFACRPKTETLAEVTRGNKSTSIGIAPMKSKGLPTIPCRSRPYEPCAPPRRDSPRIDEPAPRAFGMMHWPPNSQARWRFLATGLRRRTYETRTIWQGGQRKAGAD